MLALLPFLTLEGGLRALDDDEAAVPLGVAGGWKASSSLSSLNQISCDFQENQQKMLYVVVPTRESVLGSTVSSLLLQIFFFSNKN